MRIFFAPKAGLIALLVCCAVTAADAPKVDLKQGDAAPVFEAIDDQGQLWRSSDHVGKKYIVVYFYPGDFTPGCTAQAKSFRDNMTSLRTRELWWSASVATRP